VAAKSKKNINVYINCPYDEAYMPLFRAMIFTVFDCGFIARTVMEAFDSLSRSSKLLELIKQCRFGIHDLSRVQLDRTTRLPRFNMPFELGLFMGAREYGGSDQKIKKCLIVDAQRYRYQKLISDLSGWDIAAHENNAQKMVVIVRDWLSLETRANLPAAREIWERYKRFNKFLPVICKELKLDPDDLIFNDYVNLVLVWLRQTSSAAEKKPSKKSAPAKQTSTRKPRAKKR
jgi:hypothetical protein